MDEGRGEECRTQAQEMKTGEGRERRWEGWYPESQQAAERGPGGLFLILLLLEGGGKQFHLSGSSPFLIGKNGDIIAILLASSALSSVSS